MSSTEVDIINIYRSKCASSKDLIADIGRTVDDSKVTFLVGDFNICYLSERNHPIIRFIENMGFTQLAKLPTHKDGGLIDHVYLNKPNDSNFWRVKVVQQSPYFTDHDMLWVIKVTNIRIFNSFHGSLFQERSDTEESKD